MAVVLVVRIMVFALVGLRGRVLLLLGLLPGQLLRHLLRRPLLCGDAGLLLLLAGLGLLGFGLGAAGVGGRGRPDVTAGGVLLLPLLDLLPFQGQLLVFLPFLR